MFIPSVLVCLFGAKIPLIKNYPWTFLTGVGVPALVTGNYLLKQDCTHRWYSSGIVRITVHWRTRRRRRRRRHGLRYIFTRHS